MPSTLNPVNVVNPGPGRLPADTVPAGALIYPPGGGSDAALQAHITDPVNAHMDTAIGEAGYSAGTGNTWSIPSGSVSTSTVQLLAGVNARPMWVLDANPASTADFVGTNALINALAAIGTHHPILYLRPGTYTWNDPVPATLDGVYIIGAERTSTIIQNSSGNMRLGFDTHFENLTISLSGTLTFIGSAGVGKTELRDVILSVTGDVAISSSFNKLVHIYGSTAQFFDINGDDNILDDLVNCQIKFDGCYRSVLEKAYISTVKYSNQAAIALLGTSCSVKDVTCSGLISFNNYILSIGGSGRNNFSDGLTVSNLTTPGANFGLIGLSSASNCSVKNLYFDAPPLAQASTSTLINIDSASTNCIVEEISIIGTIPVAAGKFLVLDGTGNTVRGFNVALLNSIEAGFALAYVLGTGNRLINTQIRNIGSNSGATEPLLKLAGTSTFIDGVIFTNIGTSAGLSIPLVQIMGASSGILKKVLADSASTVLRGGHAISIDGTDPLGQWVIEDCYCDTTDVNTSNAFYWVGNTLNTSSLSVANSTFISQGDGSAADKRAAVYVEFVQQGITSFTNITAIGTKGRSGVFNEASVTIIDCNFIGGSSDAGAGRQLFYGWGEANFRRPLIMRDCVMEYGSSNCHPDDAASDHIPIIFLGGYDYDVLTDHGTFEVDGLTIYPGTSVTAGNQHRNSLLVIDTDSTYKRQASIFKNIKIDLKERGWSYSGASRGTTTTTTNAAIVEFNGDGEYPSKIENLQVYNLVSGTGVSNARHIIYATGAIADGVIIEGPSTGTYGTGTFTATPAYFDYCQVSNLAYGQKYPTALSANPDVVYLGAYSSLKNSYIRNDISASAIHSYLHMGGSYSIVSGTEIEHEAGAIAHSFVLINTVNASFVNNIVKSSAIPGIYFIAVEGDDNNLVKGNQIVNTHAYDFTANGIAVVVINSDYNHIEDNVILGIGIDRHSSNFGTIDIQLGSDSNIIANNTITVAIPQHLADYYWYPICVKSDSNIVTGNRCVNTYVDTGTAVLLVTGGATNTITSNNIQGDWDGDDTHVEVDTSDATYSVVVGNTVNNIHAGHNGTVSTDVATDTVSANMSTTK